jgi:hypothetical protein
VKCPGKSSPWSAEQVVRNKRTRKNLYYVLQRNTGAAMLTLAPTTWAENLLAEKGRELVLCGRSMQAGLEAAI